MNKKELVLKTAKSLECTIIEANSYVTAIFNEVINTLEAGEEFKMVNLGTLKVIERAEKEYFHPGLGKKMIAKPYKTVKFIISKLLKENLNK